VQLNVVEGHPAQVLVEEARGARLLVVGSRGHGSLVGMLIGSTSAHCAATAECPVVVIR
jgi:nucleotide-binding universal stress UspA family protein